MSDPLISSLPIEYELKYGTASGNIDSPHLVSDSPVDCILRADRGFSQEQLLCGLRLYSSPITIDSLNALLVRLNQR